jgi:hypothetical protein
MRFRLCNRVRVFGAVVAVAFASFGASMAEGKRARKTAAASSTEDCRTDKDCVSVQDDCCPCSQGGKQHAIPKKQRDVYERDLKKRCAGTVCTDMVSTDPSCSQRPFCGAGICELGDPTPPDGGSSSGDLGR